MVHQAEFWIKNLGLRTPCELTKRLGVAIVQVASDSPVDSLLGYNQLHDLSGIIVRKRSLIPGAPTLKRFPKDPQDFWTQYPTAYSQAHPPAPCRIDEAKIAERNIKVCIPARSTNKRARGKQPQREVEQRVAQRDPNVDMMQMMMKFMLDNRSSSSNVPPITYTPGTNAGSALTGASSSIIDAPIERRNVGAPPTDDVGKLPGVWQAPPKKASPADKLAEIRANIAAAVAKQRAAPSKQAMSSK